MKISHVIKISRLLFFSMLTCFFWTLPAGSAGTDEILPSKVISLSPIITETLYLLSAQEKLIANTSYCNYPEDAKHKDKIGSVKQANIEKILSLEPDLVIACSLTSQRQIEKLNKLKIDVIKVENPSTFDMMCEATLQIGKTVGKEVVANEIVQDARQQVSQIWNETRILTKPKVFIQIGIKPLHTANKDTFINEYIHYSGGKNIAANERTGVYSREKVLRENPDVILIATMGSSKKAGEVEKKRWLQFTSIQAVKDNRVHVLDPELICSPTPVTFVKGLKAVLPLIHSQFNQLAHQEI